METLIGDMIYLRPQSKTREDSNNKYKLVDTSILVIDVWQTNDMHSTTKIVIYLCKEPLYLILHTPEYPEAHSHTQVNFCVWTTEIFGWWNHFRTCKFMFISKKSNISKYYLPKAWKTQSCWLEHHQIWNMLDQPAKRVTYL